MTAEGASPRWSDLLGICPNMPGPAPDVTTEQVRARYLSDIRDNEWGGGSFSMADYEAAYERWLAAHDAEVKAVALREAADAVDLVAYHTHTVDEVTDAELAAESWLRARADELGRTDTQPTPTVRLTCPCGWSVTGPEASALAAAHDHAPTDSPHPATSQ